jgi:hypothetical protein
MTILDTKMVERANGETEEFHTIECDKCHGVGESLESYLRQYKDGYDPRYGWYVRGKRHYCIDCMAKMHGKGDAS